MKGEKGGSGPPGEPCRRGGGVMGDQPWNGSGPGNNSIPGNIELLTMYHEIMVINNKLEKIRSYQSQFKKSL